MSKPMGVADFFAAVFGDCVDHQHEQVGRCVYCKDCGRRLYNGTVMTRKELDDVKQVIAERPGDPR